MSASSLRRVLTGLGALALVLALAACGGEDDDDATAAAAENGTAAENVRLDQASWDEYVETRDSAREVNEQAIETFRSCRQLLGSDVPVEQVEECLGSSVDEVVTEGQEVLAVLDGLAGEVSGACAEATANLSGNIKLYISSVNAIGLSLERSSLPSDQDVASSLAVLQRSRAAATDFERACKPA